MRDQHLRRTRPARYHVNHREGNQAFPAIDTAGMTLREIRERVRGRDRRQDDDTEGQGEDE